MNAVLPYMSEKLSLQAELLYIPQKFTGTSSFANSSDETHYTFDLAYLKLPVQLRYTYPKGNIRPFVNAGYLVAYAVKDKNEKHTTSRGASTAPAKSQVWADDTYRRGMDGLSGGVGLMIPIRDNALSLEGRYERDRRFSNRVGQGSGIENYSILLSYSF